MREVSFLQIAQSDPEGPSVIVASKGGGVHPSATLELAGDGKSGVMTFPIDDGFFAPKEEGSTKVRTG